MQVLSASLRATTDEQDATTLPKRSVDEKPAVPPYHRAEPVEAGEPRTPDEPLGGCASADLSKNKAQPTEGREHRLLTALPLWVRHGGSTLLGFVIAWGVCGFLFSLVYPPELTPIGYISRYYLEYISFRSSTGRRFDWKPTLFHIQPHKSPEPFQLLPAANRGAAFPHSFSRSFICFSLL